MSHTFTKLASATVLGVTLIASGAAFAQSTASATTDLNIRSGPGPQYPVTGVINAGEQATINGCIDGSKWCTVTTPAGEGWAYSDYLAADMSGETVVVTERYQDMGVPVTTYDEGSGDDGAVMGGASGAVAGALIGGPIGAVVGGVAGAAAGGASGAIIDPPENVTTYVQSNQVEPVYLEGEVVVGAQVPETVALTEVPDYDYRYVNVNSQPVLVDPSNRQIVYVYR
nr:DUF1236 domain-containing protein [Pararhizobium haloflavum]